MNLEKLKKLDYNLQIEYLFNAVKNDLISVEDFKSSLNYISNPIIEKELKTLEKALENLKIVAAGERALIFSFKKLNQELKKMTIIDGLTQINNARQIRNIAKKDFATSRRYKFNLSFVILDIDNFKKVNDNYGHLIGDYCLQEVASILNSETRESDTIGRYGGEEFMIITKDTAENTQILMKRIKQSIESKVAKRVKNIVIKNNDKETASLIAVPEILTISCGIAELSNSINNYFTLIERADKALYFSKRNGKNQTNIWNESMK